MMRPGHEMWGDPKTLDPNLAREDEAQIRAKPREENCEEERESEEMKVEVEFMGGMDIYFSRKRKHAIDLPRTDEKGQPATVEFLIRFIQSTIMSDSRGYAMFQGEGGVRPGILVLINDADWELEGGQKYELKEKDVIVFITSLHGG